MQIWNEKLGCFEDLQVDISCAPSYNERNGIYESNGEFGVKYLDNDHYALLYAPAGTKVHISSRYHGEPMADRRKFHGINQKRRASIALVLSITRLGIARDITGVETIVLYDVTTGTSSYDRAFSYKVANIVRPSEPFDCQDRDCAAGIHYFSRFAGDNDSNIIRTFLQHWADNLIEKYYTKEKCEKMFKEKLEHENQ